MVRDEYRKRPAHPRPRACVVSMEELPGTAKGYRALITRTFRAASEDPDDVVAVSNAEVALVLGDEGE